MMALKAAIKPWPPSPLLLDDSLPQLLPKSLLKVLLSPLGMPWPAGEAGDVASDAAAAAAARPCCAGITGASDDMLLVLLLFFPSLCGCNTAGVSGPELESPEPSAWSESQLVRQLS